MYSVDRDGNAPKVVVEEEEEEEGSCFFRLFCCCLGGGEGGSGGGSGGGKRRGSGGGSGGGTRSPSSGGRALRPDEKLLKPQIEAERGRHCLVLDLDETLVHSSFKPIANADFIIPVEIEDQIHQVYVLKRPFVDEFIRRVGEWFEVVVFTAALDKYADPVVDLLDKHCVVRHRLFREACTVHKGNYVKDLSRLGRPLEKTIIIDNSPPSYLFHPENAIPILSWFDDEHDTELLDLIPFLEDITKVDDVRTVLGGISQGASPS